MLVIDKLFDLCKQARDCRDVDEKLSLERVVFEEILKIRNFIKDDDLFGDRLSEGYAFAEDSNFIKNERKFSHIYNFIFDMNNYNIEDEVISKFDTELKNVICELHKLPMWYDVSEDDLTSSPTPLCLMSNKEQYLERMLSLMDDPYAKISVYADMEKDSFIYVHNELFPPDNLKKVSKNSMIKMRFKNELNPQYKSHPCEFLLTTLLMMKAKDTTYFDYGIRYLQLLLEDLSFEWKGERILHLPLEFRSDGDFVQPHYSSLIMHQFKYILNLLSLKLHNVNANVLEKEYLDVSNEILMHLLPNPTKKGKAMKKAFTPITLYGGMDLKAKVDPKIARHEHPLFSVNSGVLDAYPYQFNTHSVCHGECDNVAGKAAYTNTVRTFVDEVFKFTEKEDLPLFSSYILRRMMPCRKNVSYIHDLIFIKMHLSASGYSHTHKLADFVPAIKDNYENNQKFINSDKVDSYHFKELLARMNKVGFDMTKKLIDSRQYPNAVSFKTRLGSYLTARSAGLSPISMEMEFEGIRDGKPIREKVKTNLTSKSAYQALRGENVFNLDLQLEPVDPATYYKSLSAKRKIEVRESGFSLDDLSAMGVSRIGSRATSGFRDIRAIFMIKLPVHLLQCALIKPHVESTIKGYKQDSPPTSMWINKSDFGRSILTTDQDGSDDVWARYVMATSTGSFLISAADCSAWDQHMKHLILDAYYLGMKEAFSSYAQLDTEYYMYMDGKGLTLMDLVDILVDYQKKALFSATYGYEAYLVLIDFLASGRFDTFFINSVTNERINSIIEDELKKSLDIPIKYVSLTVAGDDMISILDTKNTPLKADLIEKIKDKIIEVYTNCGHEINRNKTVMSFQSAEVAKRNMYCGFVFRDPNIQLFESEKSDNTESKITRIRGQASKHFEFIKRSVADLKTSTMHSRLILALMYSYKYIPRDKTVDKTIKYYPPYASVVAPTHVAGGVGASFTGTMQNEALFFIYNESVIVNKALGVLSLLKNKTNEKIQNGIMRKYIPKEKGKLLRGTDEYTKIIDIKFENTNPGEPHSDVSNGIDFKKKTMESYKVRASDDAILLAESANIIIPERLKYSNAPEIMVEDFAKNVNLKSMANKRDVDAVITSLFDTSHGEIKFTKKIPVMTLLDMYEIYRMLKVSFEKDDNSVSKTKRTIQRIASQPSSISIAERYYGSRTGKGAKLNLEGHSFTLRRFISQTGLSITSEQLTEAMTMAGVFDNQDKMESNVINFLTAISGDQQAAMVAVRDITKDDYTWDDMLTAVTISGSMVEAFDWSKEKVANCVSVTSAGAGIPINVKVMLEFNIYMLMLQQSIFLGEFYSSVHLHLKPAYEMVLNNMRKKRNKTQDMTSENNTITTVADFYVRSKIELDRKIKYINADSDW